MGESLIGRQFGSYAIQALLGKGGMGEVYLAEHKEIGRKAAVKLLKSHRCDDIRFVCLIAAPEGIEALQAETPGIPIFTASVDRQLFRRS